jgi:PilZ domain
MRVLSRGCHRPMLSIIFEFVRMTPNMLATMTLITRRKVSFAVTPKGRTGDVRHAAHEPHLLQALAIASVFAAAWFALTLLGVTPTHYNVPWAAYAALGWLVLNVVLLIKAIARVTDLRFAGERRASVRIDTSYAGSFDRLPCEILDLSLTGARIAVTRIQDKERHQLLVDLGESTVTIKTAVRTVRPDPAGYSIVGLEFLPGQNLARSAVALELFHSKVVPSRAIPADVPSTPKVAPAPKTVPGVAGPAAA